jgi:hypothetical protein
MATRSKTPPEGWAPSPQTAALTDEELIAHGRDVLREVIADIAEHCELRAEVAEQALVEWVFGPIDTLDSDALCDALDSARDILGLCTVALQPFDFAIHMSNMTRGGGPAKRRRTRGAKKSAR